MRKKEQNIRDCLDFIRGVIKNIFRLFSSFENEKIAGYFKF